MGSQFAELIHGRTVRGKVYRMLVTLFAIMLVSTAGYLAYSQRALVEGQVERQARDLAESYFDNINTLMLTGGMVNRGIPRDKLLARPDVIDARIMRGPAVTRLFGPGDASAKAVDDLKVPVMCYGLRVDFRGELFPGSAALLALADEMREESLPDEFVDTITSGWWTTCLEVLPAKERKRGRY